MAGFSINIRGVKEIVRKIETYPVRVAIQLKGELKLAAEEVRNLSVKDAPGDTGRTRNSIAVTASDNGLTQSTTVNNDYGVFQEFGTKSKAKVPGVLAAYAAQFKGAKAGTGERTLDMAIKAWVRRKGIGAKRTKSGKISKSQASQTNMDRVAYLIARSIYKKGGTPHPFFFKNVFLVRRKLEQRIPKIVQDV